MARIRDKRLQTGKANRAKLVKEYFNKRWNDGLRYDVIEEEIILKFGISATTINRIMKGLHDEQREQKRDANRTTQ